VWNLLADLRKITGGGSEAFWLRANQGLHLDVDKDMALESTKDTVAALKEQAEAYKHQLDRWIRTRGVKISTLGSDVANFANPADAVITQIAGAKRTPKRILTGSEMGELASTQDRENFRDQVNGRQAQHCAPVVRRLIDRLVTYGYMPAPAKGPLEYQVKWPKVEVQSETEKADGATKWSQTKVGEDPVFTSAEIRDKWYGMAPLTAEQMAEVDKRKEEAVKRQQQAMGGQQDEPPALRAAEDDEIVRILADAIRSDAAETVLQIVGMRTARFNPDQARDERGRWTDGGGSSGSNDAKSGNQSGRFAKIERKYPPANPNGLDTQQRYKRADGTYTPERQALHNQIEREMIGDALPVDNPTGYIIGGGWAAGKSTILQTGEVDIPKNHIRSDGDANKLLLPEYQAQVGKDPHISGYVHEESSDIAKRMTTLAANGHYNVVLDGTGDGTYESLAKKVAVMRAGGLRVEANYVTVDTATAIKRAKERGEKTGRHVPEEGLRAVHKEVSRILPRAMAEGLFDKATLWDTNGGRPRKVATSIGKNVEIHNQSLWLRFVAKADE
jgi:predicted ABC-type ATPase